MAGETAENTDNEEVSIMILYGKPVADALREHYAEWIEAMAWKRTLAVIKDDTSDKGYLAAIQREA